MRMLKLTIINTIYPNWDVPENIKSFQTTRKTKNINFLKNEIDLNFNFINQEHGNKSIKLPNNLKSNADAVFTYEEKTICAVQTADCLPIILTDKVGSFVAAIHAGWRGMSMGIIEKTIQKINNQGEIIAWLGPCISQSNYEVGEDVFKSFLENDKNISSAFKPIENNKFLFSLSTAAISKLNNLSVFQITGMDTTDKFCTFEQESIFYSYRRGDTAGRIATFIWKE